MQQPFWSNFIQSPPNIIFLAIYGPSKLQDPKGGPFGPIVGGDGACLNKTFSGFQDAVSPAKIFFSGHLVLK